ncbi:amidohydrolase family protein [Longibacter sp.]|uniref:amidohydrolase family protein n=1 Tax=Longibacter sp. TaxID=2045415 RepID=UPI003EB8C68B
MLIAVVAVLCLPASHAQEQEDDAQAVALIDGTVVTPGADPISDAVVVIRGDRITSVGSNDDVTVPDNAVVVDVSGRYIMPGMVDGHVHFFQSGGLYTRPDVIDLRAARPYDEEIAMIEERLPDTFRRYLASGVTSVVDVGGPMWNLDVRAQADTARMAPTVVTAGPLISSVEPDEFTVDDKPILRFESPGAAREEVRRQVNAGVDLIKIWYIVRGQGPEAFRPVVDAVIDEAHGLDTRVAVHATGLETARTAVEAGADILVHSVYDRPVDNAFVQELVAENVLYVPTLMVSERYGQTFAQTLNLTVAEHRIGQKDVIASLFDLQVLPDSLLSDRMRRMIAQRPAIPSDSVAMQNLKAVHDAGVTVVAGTDAGNIGTLHGPSLSREFELMRAAGLSPAEILETATVGGATLMGRDDLGRVEAGMQADLAIVNGNPLDDLAHAFDVDAVVRRGELLRIESLLPTRAEAPVQQQLNAYNAHDIDGFLDAYADSVKVYAYPNRLQMTGTSRMRDVYSQLFSRNPTLFANVTRRMVQGTVVIDEERVRGMASDGDVTNAIAIYHVNEDGKIARVEFVR